MYPLLIKEIALELGFQFLISAQIVPKSSKSRNSFAGRKMASGGSTAVVGALCTVAVTSDRQPRNQRRQSPLLFTREPSSDLPKTEPSSSPATSQTSLPHVPSPL
ncbi:hypothetical protein U1Q18_033704 [Sarracenia purpurea var. burkii]